jgi:hypothetical protein
LLIIGSVNVWLSAVETLFYFVVNYETPRLRSGGHLSFVYNRT